MIFAEFQFWKHFVERYKIRYLDELKILIFVILSNENLKRGKFKNLIEKILGGEKIFKESEKNFWVESRGKFLVEKFG